MEEKIRDLFNKYVEGTASAKERQVVEDFFEKMQEGGVTPERAAHDRLLLNRLDEKVFKRTIYRRRFQRRAMLVAAASLLVLLSAVIPLILRFQETTITVLAQQGERTRVVLPDSSVAYLNSGSAISYSSRMRGSERTITLSGEAYFEVKHDPSKPFIVESSTLKTHVLGTRFVVSDYPGEEASVVVRSGKVGVAGADNRPLAILETDQRVYYKNGIPLVEPVEAKDYYSWKDGNIVFEAANLKQVIHTLNRRFNVNIVLTSSFDEKCTITGSYPDRHIEDVLKSLQFLYGIEYSFEGTGEICLKANPC
ncbi:FecR domain-containing protein [Fulvivirgaceae bacterium PWU5]|uniref:FecR domain-containing protein n=1 Tax=Dawidia cretensis TaxID=2782350 RepID=A0AAP2DTI6_9BACT|nr:FecR domain-containing protein [Dawidia cretensis]MBT1707270.1 FecR domain-containing protein [Dawidia cretensis]